MPALLSLASAILAFLPCLADDTPPQKPNAFHVGTFKSALGARVDAAGHIDSGDGVVSLFDASTGEPLVPRDMQYDVGPKLSLTWNAACGDATISARMAAIPLTAGGDSRLTTAILLTIENASMSAVTTSLGVRFTAGGEADDDSVRPRFNEPYDASSRYELDDDGALLRDGRIVMRWTGTKPQVNVTETPSGPDAAVCELSWPDLEVAPRTLLSITLFVAGPPTTSKHVESRWRRLFESLTYITAEERANWDIKTPSTLRLVRFGDKPTFRGLRSAIFMVRLLGIADDVVHEPRVHPYHLERTTVAQWAEVLAGHFEWNMPNAVSAQLGKVIGEAEATIESLDAEERLAVGAALARCVRLGGSSLLVGRVAAMLRDYVCVEEMNGVAVRPWEDPTRAAAAMSQVLDDAGIDVEIPTFAWADVEVGTPAAAFQSLCRATSARDLDGVLTSLRDVQSFFDVNTIGRMDPDGEPDAVFSLAYLQCLRNLLIDDFGPALVVMPGIPSDFLVDPLESSMLPSRYGPLRYRAWWTTKKRRKINIDLTHIMMRSPESVLWALPDSREIEQVSMPEGGSYVVDGVGSIELVGPGKVQAEVRLAKE